MSRGIITKQYNTLLDINNAITSGELQYRDIAFINPTSVDQKISIYQVLYSEGTEDKIAKEIKGSNSEFDTFIFTDDTFISNVTPIRKAHTEDIREIVKFIAMSSASKYGETLTGLYNIAATKLSWATNAFLQYPSNNELIVSFDGLLKFKYNNLIDILVLSSDKLDIFKDLYVTSNVFITGNQTNTGNISVEGNIDVTGDDSEITVSGNVQLGVEPTQFYFSSFIDNIKTVDTIVALLNVNSSTATFGPDGFETAWKLKVTRYYEENEVPTADLQIEYETYTLVTTGFGTQTWQKVTRMVSLSHFVFGSTVAALPPVTTIGGAGHTGTLSSRSPYTNKTTVPVLATSRITPSTISTTELDAGIVYATSSVNTESLKTTSIEVSQSVSTGLVTQFNADLLDNKHYTDIIDDIRDMIPIISYDGTTYLDAAGTTVGQSMQIEIGELKYFVPGSLKPEGACHSKHSSHSSCHTGRMCHAWKKKIEKVINND